MFDLSNPAVATPYLIPLQAENQQFNISLNGTTYILKLRWNVFAACWILYISDSSGDPILSGVPLITGADLLEQLGYLGIGGALVVQSTDNPDLVPNYSTLGTTGNLFFLVPVAA